MTKLEDVAKAIYDRTWESSWDGLAPNGVERALSLEIARVAVEAMREPTVAQYDALAATDLMWKQLNSTKVWQTYIDAILNEKPTA